LSLTIQLLVNLADLLFKAQIKQTISLVEDEHLDSGQV